MAAGAEQMLNNNGLYLVRQTDIINHFTLHIHNEDNRQQKSYIVLATGPKNQIPTCKVLSLCYTVRSRRCDTTYDQCKMMNDTPVSYSETDAFRVTCRFRCNCSDVGNQCTIHAKTFYGKNSPDYYLVKVAVQLNGLDLNWSNMRILKKKSNDWWTCAWLWETKCNV